MDREIARAMVPVWANSEAPTMPRKMKAEIEFERLKKRYALALIALFIWAASMILGCCVTGVIVYNNAMADLDQAKHDAVEEYKQEQALKVQAEHWKSGEASREAARNQDIALLARWMSFFPDEKAKMSFGGNVLVRWLSPKYPNDLRSVLTEPGQFTFGNENLVSSPRDEELAGIIWDMHEANKLPTGLTMDHLYGEVRDGGQDYVVRNEYQKSSSTDYWRWQGEIG